MEYKIAQEYPVTSQKVFTIQNSKKAILNPSLAITVAKAQIKNKVPFEEYSSKYLDIAEGGFSDYPDNIEDYAEWSWQFDFVKQFGLEPDDFLLDIGCGHLRGGVQFIPYLSKGHYFGIDISEDAIKESKRVVRKYELSNKRPKVFQNNDLKFNNPEFEGIEFDYILAQSVITHLPPEDVEELLANIHKVLSTNGSFIATYHKSPDNTIKQFARIVDFGYPWEFFEDISQEYNLDITEIEGNHPKDHSLIKIELD